MTAAATANSRCCRLDRAVDAGGPRCAEHAGQTGQRRAEDEGRDADPIHVDAGTPRCFGVLPPVAYGAV